VSLVATFTNSAKVPGALLFEGAPTARQGAVRCPGARAQGQQEGGRVPALAKRWA
jgi:hypothetical protein